MSVRSEDTLYYPAGRVVEVGALGVDVVLGTGMGLKIFSAAQPEVQSSVFQANILVTFPQQVTTRIYKKEDYMSNTRVSLST